MVIFPCVCGFALDRHMIVVSESGDEGTKEVELVFDTKEVVRCVCVCFGFFREHGFISVHFTFSLVFFS